MLGTNALPRTKKPASVTELSIKGVVLMGDPIYSEGVYAVYVGYIESIPDKDIPHYLAVNCQTGVVEGSSARLFEARGLCQAFHREVQEQDRLISQGIDMVERRDDERGNRDPDYMEPKIKWKPN